MDTRVLIEKTEDRAWVARASKAWVNMHINHEELAENVKGTIEFLRAEKETDEDGNYTAWGVALVSGSYGHHMPVLYLHSALWITEDRDELVKAYTSTQTDYDFYEAIMEQGGIMDNVMDAMTDALNAHKPKSLPGSYFIGYHEADGSLGIFYTEDGGNN